MFCLALVSCLEAATSAPWRLLLTSGGLLLCVYGMTCAGPDLFRVIFEECKCLAGSGQHTAGICNQHGTATEEEGAD